MADDRVVLRSPMNGGTIEVTPDHPLWPMLDELVKRGFTREDEDKPKRQKESRDGTSKTNGRGADTRG